MEWRLGWVAFVVDRVILGDVNHWIEHMRAAATGLVVAHVWRGHGSALFIEFGTLTPSTLTRRDGTGGAPSGEVGLMLDGGWRIEDARAIVCGSDGAEELWGPTFDRLLGKRVVDVSTFGRLPEILVSFSEDLHVASFSTVEGDPEWALFDRRACAEITVGCSSGTITGDPVPSA